MKPTITLDTTPMQQVFREYARWNRRDWPELANAKGLDFLFRVMKETPKANVADIKALESKEWWPKYVAKRLTGGLTFRKGKAKIHLSGKGFTRQEARQASKAIIAGRSRSVAFVKSGWLEPIRRLYGIVRDKTFARGSVGGARQYGAPKGSVRPAVPGDSPAVIMMNSAMGVEKVGVQPAERAMNQVAADMLTYIARKMEERARRVAR